MTVESETTKVINRIQELVREISATRARENAALWEMTKELNRLCQFLNPVDKKDE